MEEPRALLHLPHPPHPYVQLAVEAIRKHLAEGEILEATEDRDPSFRRKAGVFVSIKKAGRLRGCMGTIEPAQSNLAREIVYNAISAACQDPRFPPVSAEELPDLRVSIDVLGTPERVDDLAELDPKNYGLIVRRGDKRGLLLPDLEGVETSVQQVSIAKRKAGIDPAEDCDLERFATERYS